MLICVKTLSLPHRMKIKFLLLTITIVLILLNCKPKNEIFSTDAGIKLRFSTDTLWFDTLFSTVKSVTLRAKVYNPSVYAVNISQIRLANANSPFLVYVNGQDIKTKSNAELLGKDSLLILVSVTINPLDKTTAFLVEDAISFITNGNEQQLKLIAYGQDAIFHRSTPICDQTWESNKPHVVIGMLTIDSSCFLNIHAGTTVYFGNNSGLNINGRILIKGTSSNKVELRAYRKEQSFENVAGQWQGIKVNPSSTGNEFHWTTIANAQTGIAAFSKNDQDSIPELLLSHCIIKNMDNAGLTLNQSDIIASNSLFTNCANYVLNSVSGGNQTFIHCTFTNYGLDFFRINPCVVFDQAPQPLYLKFFNNIVWGNLQNEYEVLNKNSTVTYLNNIIRSSNITLKLGGNKISTNRNYIRFKNIFNYDFTPDTLTPAIDSAFFIKGFSDSLDLFGTKRKEKPDIGAIEKPEK